jgi:hypothetical protein
MIALLVPEVELDGVAVGARVGGANPHDLRIGVERQHRGGRAEVGQRAVPALCVRDRRGGVFVDVVERGADDRERVLQGATLVWSWGVEVEVSV